MSDDVISSTPVNGKNLATLKSTCTKSKGDSRWYPRSTVRVRQIREEPSHNSIKINRVQMREAETKKEKGGGRKEEREKKGERGKEGEGEGERPKFLI